MSFEYDPVPAFCPFTGKMCGVIGNHHDCIEGACGKYWEDREKPAPEGMVKACVYHATCLITTIDCDGTIEESERRGCKAPMIIIPKEEL